MSKFKEEVNQLLKNIDENKIKMTIKKNVFYVNKNRSISEIESRLGAVTSSRKDDLGRGYLIGVSIVVQLIPASECELPY